MAANLFIGLKEISAIFFFSNFFLGLIPTSIPASSKALSVGLPLKIHSSFGSVGFSIKAAEVRVAAFKVKNLSPITSPAFIFPSVKVAVLSLQITEVLPNVSAEANFLTNPFFFNILCIPRAKITVIATGNPSGIAATATATAVVNISINFPPVIIPSIKIPIQIILIIIPTILEKAANFF